MPEIHLYQTYEPCQSNLCWSLLTFDWRTSTLEQARGGVGGAVDERDLTSTVVRASFSWIDLGIILFFDKLQGIFVLQQQRGDLFLNYLNAFKEHSSNNSTHAYTSSQTTSLLSCGSKRYGKMSHPLCCTSLLIMCANSGTAKPRALVGPECWPETSADTHMRRLLCVHHPGEANVSGVVASLERKGQRQDTRVTQRERGMFEENMVRRRWRFPPFRDAVHQWIRDLPSPLYTPHQ